MDAPNPVSLTLVSIGLKAGLLVLLGAAINRLATRASAAQRGAVWLGVASAIALLPIADACLPHWQLPGWSFPQIGRISDGDFTPGNVRVAELSYEPSLVMLPADDARPAWSWDAVVVPLFLFGALFQLAKAILEIIRWRRRVRMALPVDLVASPDAGKWPRVAQYAEGTMPVLAGWWRPAILLPPAASRWSKTTQNAVLLHEYAHFRRRDHWAQPLLILLRIVYWWHPAVWFMAHRLRIEREKACDDFVLRSGVRASEYAGVLMRVVRGVQSWSDGSRGAMAMASAQLVGARMDALLSRDLNRAAAGRALGALVAILAVIAAAMVGSLGNFKPPIPVAALMSHELPEGVAATQVAQNSTGTIELIEVAARFIEVSEANYAKNPAELDRIVQQADLVALNVVGNVDLLSAPGVIVRPGQRSVIQIMREFRYPVKFERSAHAPITPVKFKTENLGLEFGFDAEAVKDSVQIQGTLVLRDFDGFTEGDENVKVPTFTTKEANMFRVISDGRTVGFGVPGLTVRDLSRNPSFMANGGAEPASEPHVPYRIAIFLSAKIKRVSQPTDGVASPKSGRQGGIAGRAGSSPSQEDIPFGQPIAGKPGFFRSPFLPHAGYVDLRGYSPGVEVKDPFSGKIFRMP